MSDVTIKVENLSKKYQIGKARSGTLRDTLAIKWGNLVSPGRSKEEFWALKDVSFEVKNGEVLGVIGRNGAGKSTLLKILSRITEPTTGRVELNGRVASLLEVGTGFHPELTGRENIFLNGALLGMTRQEIKSKFDEIVDFSGVEQFIDTPVKKYSSGMYVRLAFAVAAHLESEILLVDEVLAVGDYEFQKKCLGKIKDISKNEKSIIVISHNMSVIKSICSHAILLVDGKINELNIVHQVISKYLNINKTSEYNNFISNSIYSESTDIAIILEKKEFYYNRPIRFFITINNYKLPRIICIAIQNENFETIFISERTIDHSSVKSIHCVIPPNILIDNEYYISLFFKEENTSVIKSKKEYINSFKILGRPQAYSHYKRNNLGYINDCLVWKIKY